MSVDNQQCANGPHSGVSKEGDSDSDPAVLVPVFDEVPPRSVLDTAIGLVEATSTGVLLLKTVTVAEQTPLELTDEILDDPRTRLDDALDAVPETESAVDGVVRVGHTLEATIVTAVEDHGTSLIATELPGSNGRSTYRPFRAPLVERVGVYADCDVVVGIEADDYGDVSAILVPISGGPHSERAVDVARALAAYHDAWIELLHVIEAGASDERREQANQYLAAAVDRLGEFENYDTWVLEAGDAATAIIEQSAYYDVTIIGAPRKGRLRRFVFGSTTAAVRADAESTVMTVRRRDGRSRIRRWFGSGAEDGP